MHKCNHCNNFIRRYGNIVAITEDYKLISLFSFIPESEEFIPVCNTLALHIETTAIKDVFFETFEELNGLPYESCNKTQEVYRLGIHKNVKRYTKAEAELYGVVKENELRTFDHMYLELPRAFVLRGKGSIEAISAGYRDNKQVFQRAMEEISLDTLNLVKDLIQQGSLLDGDTHLSKITDIIPLKEAFLKAAAYRKDEWCWVHSYNLPIAKFKNTLIGVLCSELAEGMEINKACQNWNKRVDPVNYMKATAPITKNQIKEAKIFVEENGYETAFSRRPATIDDIKASEILHLNGGDGKIEEVSIFDGVKSTSTKHKRSEFDGVEEISIDKFMKDILPGCESVEVFLKNNQENNMVTLTTAATEGSKDIFKWNNNYSWSYNGNLAGKSMIKESVKSLGGKVDGVLRFSIMWAEDNVDDSDLDAHCVTPKGFRIYYGDKRDSLTMGNLDIDIMNPQSHKRSKTKNVVENITFPFLNKMSEGRYRFIIRQFAARQSQGFKAEIEFDGELYSYEYNNPVRGDVAIAEVTLKDGNFTIVHNLPATDGEGVNKEIYSLETNHFHKVDLICLSPNHWGTNDVGNRHYFFMLNGAQAKKTIRSFHNENLKSDLVSHRKVMEVLANTTMVESKPKELSGLGFNATVRDEVILRLKGSHKRVVKVKF